MKRRLLRIIIRSLAVLSLLLCVVTCVLWVRSYSQSVHIGYDTPESKIGLNTDSGAIWIGRALNNSRGFPPQGFYWEVEPSGSFAATPWGKFDAWWKRDEKCVIFPHWCLAVLFAIFPGVVAWRHRRKSLPDADHCAKCGYDLRATPSRCPECGTAALKAASAAV